ncbi:Putative molybdopterin biosynthesis MoaE [Septoria linicola]|uniref:Molybdopterin biosynthesis MoaE n=1 Tax=Septoria linicola TaxID=215465 RepID=A0A9Q9ARN8_9PEZI|nr:putative molybdopterin biosynthesis MoaE [Septoria linicola]USW50796.1 Putative molybdopterin biosynthesis MoaE [Septoria linicola]
MPLSRENVAANIAAVKEGEEAEQTDKMGAAESSTNGNVPNDDKKFEGEQSREDEENVYVSLTYDTLDATKQMARVKSAKAGAVVLFAGCTRDTFQSKAVTHLAYSTYAPLALKTLSRIACSIKKAHHLTAIAITHRLGRVDIGEESILIAIASPHRQAAWQAGEACLEDVKQSAEIWKEEWFKDGGMWRSNRDGKAGVPVRRASEAKGKGKEEPSGGERRSSKGKERKISISTDEAKERLPSRRKSSAAGRPSQIGIKKAATEPARPKPVKRTTTFYEGGFEV